jgi:hypothetical protein
LYEHLFADRAQRDAGAAAASLADWLNGVGLSP